MVSKNNIPDVLKQVNQWILWKESVNSIGKATKLPITVSGTPASTTDPNTWTTFDKAVEAHNGQGRGSGLGFVFTHDDDFVGIDFDGCRNPETGVFAPWAKEWISKLGSYSEMSPSKTGAKVWVVAGRKDDSGKQKSVEAEPVSCKPPGVEVYSTGRYFAVTGQALNGLPKTVEERTDVIDELEEHFFGNGHASQPVFIASPVTSSDVVERAQKYLDKIESAVSGERRQYSLFRVACILWCEFGLSESDCWALLSQYNSRANPPLNEKRLRQKLADAMRKPRTLELVNDTSRQLPVSRLTEDEENNVGSVTLEDLVLENIASPAMEQNLFTTGFAALDYCLGGGIAMGELVVVAARPSMGKTAVGLQMIHEINQAGVSTLFVNEEMTESALSDRALRYLSSLAVGEWHKSQDMLKADAEHFFSKRAKCYVESNVRHVEKAVALIEKYHHEKNVRMVVVDYAQLLDAKGNNRYELVSNMSRELKRVTKRLNIIVVMLCQLGRSIEDRRKFIPQMSDLKESGQIEQDADTIIGLVYPHVHDETEPEDGFQIYVLKNKERGIVGHSCRMKFNPRRQRFWPEDTGFAVNFSGTLDGGQSWEP